MADALSVVQQLFPNVTSVADGVIMSVSIAYVITGTKAVRYKVPEAVAREVVSFDRHGGFETGEYALKAPPPAMHIGARHSRSGGGHDAKNGGLAKRFVHHTGNIRASLGSRGAV